MSWYQILTRARCWLAENKVFFEVISFAVMPALMVVLAIMQYRIMSIQTEIQNAQLRAQSYPIISILAQNDFGRANKGSKIAKDTFTVENKGGPAYIDTVEVMGFLLAVLGPGTDSTCSYLVPIDNTRFTVIDNGHVVGNLLELDITSGDWVSERAAFLREFRNDENTLADVWPSYFLKIGYTDAQGTNRHTYYSLRQGDQPQRIGSMMWSRGNELHRIRRSNGFSINLKRDNSTELVNVFRDKSANIGTFCTMIGAPMPYDSLRNIFVDE